MEFSGERFVPSLHGQIYYEHVHRYAIAARFSAGKRVLDIASGEGYGASILARGAAEVTGVDIDDASIAHARGAYYASNLRFLHGSALEIPLADGSVDVAASFETIEHIGQPELMLDELSRVLVPEGLLIISSPNKRVYSDLPEYSNPFHVRELYFSELRDALQRRFRHVTIYGQRLVAASLVHPLAGAVSRSASWYNGTERAPGEGLPTVGNPAYFFAICTDGPFDADACSAFLDPGDDVLADISKELDALRRHYALTVHGPGQQNGNGVTALSAAVAASLPAADPPLVKSADDERYAAQVIETQRVRDRYEDALKLLRDHEAALAAAHERERSALAALEEARSAAADSQRLFEAQVKETARIAASYEELVVRLRDHEAALVAANERERSARDESARSSAEREALAGRLEEAAAALASNALRDEERAREVLRLTSELRDAADARRTLAEELEAARSAASLHGLAEEERDAARREIASLRAALENTEESVFIVRQAFERGRELAESQRAALSHYERSLEAAEAGRLGLLGRIDDLLAERARMEGTAQRLQAAQHMLARRSVQLAEALASAGRLQSLLEDGFADRDRGFETLRAVLVAAARDERERAERAADVLAERTLQLGEALATAASLRTVLGEGLADRDRSFEALRALVAERDHALDAAPTADVLAERTVQLGEALAAAAGLRDVLGEGLADRERSFEALLALVAERDRALGAARADARRATHHVEHCREDALEEALEHEAAQLEKRTIQLADSLTAAARTRATMIEVLRIYREAFELLHARHAADRRAAVREPSVLRRAARRLAHEAKTRFPPPLVRFAGSVRRRTRPT